MLLTNARIYTLDERSAVVDTLVVRDGRIVFAGSRRDVNAPASEPVMDLEGRAVLPGLVDGHGHLMHLARGRLTLDATGLAPYFHASRCADEGHTKPHPGMLQAVMRELGAAADRTLMIGDTTHDLEMARAAGVAALGVAYGAHAREALLALNPLACLASVAELRDWLAAHG